ncbi:glycosyltransferase [Herbaspirillum rhizosphaerae]|uniref:Glycosyltransferase n=1 Tax=Herbaspirillum rhizosphaerae TaxID=346179 RepID=A0ABW8Z7U0_9BURK
MSGPALSVVMPVYNGETHLVEALQSVLQQSFADFEILIIDDGSTDNSCALISQFSDSRVQLIKNPSNVGLVPTLNIGLSLCKGKFIARMDQDDICEPTRFAEQIGFLSTHADVDIVGCAIRFFGAIKTPYVHVFPSEHKDIHVALLFYCSLAHPTLMFRRSLVDSGLFNYANDFRHAEDYHLWSRLLLRVRAANLPQHLLSYRLHQKQYSSTLSNGQYDVSLKVRKLMLSEAGVTPTQHDIDLHESVILERPLPGAEYLEEIAAWFGKIEDGNTVSAYWDTSALHQLLRGKFSEVVLRQGSNPAIVARGVNAARYFDPADIVQEKRSARAYLHALLRRLRRIMPS